MQKKILIMLFLLAVFLICGCDSDKIITNLKMLNYSNKSVLQVNINKIKDGETFSGQGTRFKDIIQDGTGNTICVVLDKPVVEKYKLNFNEGIYFVGKNNQFSKLNMQVHQRRDNHFGDELSISGHHFDNLLVGKDGQLKNKATIHFKKIENPLDLHSIIFITEEHFYDAFSKTYKTEFYVNYIPVRVKLSKANEWILFLDVNKKKKMELADGFDLAILNMNSEKTKSSIYQTIINN